MPQTRPTFAGRLRGAPGPAAEKGEERNRQHDEQRDEEQALAVVRPKFPEGDFRSLPLRGKEEDCR